MRKYILALLAATLAFAPLLARAEGPSYSFVVSWKAGTFVWPRVVVRSSVAPIRECVLQQDRHASSFRSPNSWLGRSESEPVLTRQGDGNG